MYPEIAPGRKKHILYVENDHEILDITKKILEYLGFEVTDTIWSEQAIRLMQSQPDNFDLVITDLGMPDMDGIELSKKIFELRPDIPIVLCTGKRNIESEEIKKNIGVNEILFKPFRIKEIKRTINKALNDQ